MPLFCPYDILYLKKKTSMSEEKKNEILDAKTDNEELKAVSGGTRPP